MASSCPDDFRHGVEIVASGGMNGHARRLVDYDHIVVFVDHSNGLRRDGGLMPMEGMADDIAVLELRLSG
jgi:hypothetical protein